MSDAPSGRRPVQRRSTPLPPMGGDTAQAAISPEQPDANALKVVFVDDEQSFLDALVLQGSGKRQMDLKPLLASKKNHLMQELVKLDQEGWRPDLLCIDLYEASGDGVAGMEYLRFIRDDEHWIALPVVLTSKADTPEEEARKSGRDLVHAVYAGGADGYLLGKTPDRRFLQLLQQQMSAWRTQARQRVWWQLLEHNRERMKAAQDEAGLEQALQDTLDKLATWLGINHAFIRIGPEHQCPVWVRHGGDWAQRETVVDLREIPLIRDVIGKAGQVTAHSAITLEQCGPYTALVGKAYMGCALLAGKRLLGVMTVVCDAAGSFGPLDTQSFQRLAEQVAAVLGAREFEHRNTNMRAVLLSFAEALSTTHDEHAVCQALAQAAQDVAHEDVPWSKCTVRLVEPGYPLLRRYGAVGKVAPGGDIPLHLKAGVGDSMFRRAVTGVCVVHAATRADFVRESYLNHNQDASGKHWWDSLSAITVPLTLERPDSQPGALGAINLECDREHHYEGEAMRAFLSSLALSASRHITALRTARFAQQALDLAAAAYSAVADALWRQVDATLFTLLGHNQLLQLDPPPGWDGRDLDTPWSIQRAESIDPERYSTNVEAWSAHFQGSWSDTFTRRSLEVFIQTGQATPRFTADRSEFIQSEALAGNETIEANAIMPLWEEIDGMNRLSGAVLLSWFSPPVMDKQMFDQVLDRFARYCALLLRHRADRKTGAELLRRAEDQAALAFAARQFEHVLNNLLAELMGRVQAGLIVSDLSGARMALRDIGSSLERLELRARKSALYMAPPQSRELLLAAEWHQVLDDLQDKAARNQVQVWRWGTSPIGMPPADPGEPYIHTDPNYLWNALYVLVDNAIEAHGELPGGRPRDVWLEASANAVGAFELRVCDNGPGVKDPSLLFQWGKSSKPKGQGVALALARERLRVVGMELLHERVDGTTCFRLRFVNRPSQQGV